MRVATPYYALSVLALLIFMITAIPAYAQTTHEIIILSGSADTASTDFWFPLSQGIASNEITINTGDTIVWTNSDVQPHTVTSVTTLEAEIKEDGIFDSGIIGITEKYSQTFNKAGDFYYYCTPHPWMTGTIHVKQNPGTLKTLNHIAFGQSIDGDGFTVRYISDVNLDNAVKIESDSSTLTFTLQGNTNAGKITMVLPNELIMDANMVLVDGELANFTAEPNDRETVLIIEVNDGAQEITIIGSKVIPEFGFMVVLILIVSITLVLFITRFRLPQALMMETQR